MVSRSTKNQVGVRAVWDNKDFIKGMNAYQAGLKKGVTQTQQASRQTETATKKTAALGNAWKVAGSIIGVYAAGQIVRGGVELAKLGEQSIRTRKSFQEVARQAGGSADDILASLTRASQGSIAQTDLMLTANNAMLLGLGANADQLGQLMQVAAFRGQAMGLSITQAFSDIVRGIGRKSPLILDNLGIVGLSMGETTTKADLMAQVIGQGMEQIAKAGGEAAISVSSFEQMGAAINDLKTALGELLAPSVAAGAQMLAGSIRTLTTSLKDLQAIQSGIAAAGEAEVSISIFAQQAMSAQELANRLAMLADQQTETGKAQGRFNLEQEGLAANAKLSSGEIDRQNQLIAALRPMIDITVGSFADYHRVLQNLTEAQSAGVMTWREYMAAVKAVKARMDELKKAELDAAAGAGRLASLRRQELEQLDKLGYAYIRAGRSSELQNKAAWENYRAIKAQTEARKAHVHQLFLEAGAYDDLTDEMLNYVGGLTYTQQKELELWQIQQKGALKEAGGGTVAGPTVGAPTAAAFDPSSLISPLLQPSGQGWARTALQGFTGEMGDAWDEEARRWADVAAQGKGSPWAQMLDIPDDVMDEGKETIKAYAANMQSAFYADPLGTTQDPAAMTDRLLENLKTSLEQKAAEKNLIQSVWEKAQEDPEAVALLKAAGVDAANALATGAAESGVDIVGALLGMDTGAEGGTGVPPALDGAVLAQGLITPLETAFTNFQTGTAQPFFADLQQGWTDVQENTDNYSMVTLTTGLQLAMQTTKDAGIAMTDAFIKGFKDGAKAAKDFEKEVDEIRKTWDNIKDKTVTLTIKVKRGGGGGDSGGGGSMGAGGTGPSGGLSAIGQHGLDMIVPPGYANDTFPVYTSSYERVIVQTPAQQAATHGPVTIGPNYISNGMDLQAFNANVRSVIGSDYE